MHYNLTSAAVLLHVCMHAHVSLPHIVMSTGVSEADTDLHIHIHLNKQMSAC